MHNFEKVERLHSIMEVQHCKCCDQNRPCDWFLPNRKKCRSCRSEDRKKHRLANPDAWKAIAARQREKNREKYREQARVYNRQLRVRAIAAIGEAECVRCGCDRFELLEINHKNGGGAKEMREQTACRSKWYNNQMFYQDIVQGRREVDDLEILCKPCNGIHYLELKYGRLLYTITWQKQKS